MPKKKDVMDQEMTTRSLSLRLLDGGGPASLDEKTRSVAVICATENPVDVYDYSRWEIIPEVLLMSGCQFPESRQVPLLDSHSRYNTSSVIGSCRELEVEGSQLVGRAHYSEVKSAEETWQKTREGHLTDYSIGYRVLEATYVPDGESAVIDGRTFEGPVKVATSWKVRELSACPIGADEIAKARAATPPETHTQGVEPMPKGKKPVEIEGRGAPEPTEKPSQPNGVTEDEAKRMAQAAARDAARAERVRCDEINSMCDHYGYGDLARELISGEKTVEEARAAVMKKNMGEESTGQQVGHRGEIIFGADASDKFRAAGVDSLLIRGGVSLEAPAAGARDLAGLTLRELARESLRMAGMPVGGDPMAMLGRALTASDFPLLLADSANKSLLEGFDAAEETWRLWCGVGNVSDFKTHKAARAGEADDLDEISEDNEYQYGQRAEQGESYSITTFGKLFKISRQTLINDDLGALVDIPMAHGEAWSRKLGDLAIAVLTANAAMGDGTALFHSTHKNLGTAGAISETTMAEGILKMGTQKDISGKRSLNINPRFVLAPKALEGGGEVFFGSNQFAAANTATTRSNPYAGSKYQRIYEGRLDDDSATAWYLLGARGKTVKLFFLNGNQLPTLESKQGWNIDGIEYKVRGDAGAKAMSWKGMFKNAGA